MQRYYLLTDIATQIQAIVERLLANSLTYEMACRRQTQKGWPEAREESAVQTEADNKALCLKPKVIEG